MSLFNKKRLYISLLATALLMGCASTDPYKPQSDKDFVYDPAKSFAMNVIDGSLGFHNGLTDANRPKDADTTPGAGSYAADAIIGFGNGGGLGGAFLSMLSTNQGKAPLDYGYLLAYISADSFSEINAQLALSQAIDKINKTIEETFYIKHISQTDLGNNTVQIFEGDYCVEKQILDAKLYTDSFKNKIGIKQKNQCLSGGFSTSKILRTATSTPTGKLGKFYVIGFSRVDLYTPLKPITLLSEDFYYFQPTNRKISVPFVFHNKKAWLFLKDSENQSINMETLLKINPNLQL